MTVKELDAFLVNDNCEFDTYHVNEEEIKEHILKHIGIQCTVPVDALPNDSTSICCAAICANNDPVNCIVA